MGCVSSRSFRSGPEKGSRYSPMSRNASASFNPRYGEERDGSDHNVTALKASSNGELDEPTCHGSFLNMGKSLKQYKILPRDTDYEESFTFTSTLDVKSTNPTFACEKPRALQSRREPHVENRHYLMCDYLNMQHMVVRKGTNGSSWEDEDCGLLACDVGDADKMRNSITTDVGLQGNETRKSIVSDNRDGSQHEGANVGKLDNERKRLLSNNSTEIIDMKELMAGLEDGVKTRQSSLKSRSPSTLSIPEREISFNSLPDLGDVSATSEIGSPVWKKYYTQDNQVVSGNAWNMSSPAGGSPFNESPRRALSQSSFTDVDDTRSVSSMEIPLSNAIGLKILLSPANSSFHPSPVNRALPSLDSNHDGLSFLNGKGTIFGGYTDDTKSPYRSRERSMESISGSIGLEKVGSDLRDPFQSQNLTRCSSSDYGSASPLFDPSLMATFEQALKVSACVPSYENWLQHSMDESLLMPLANTSGLVFDESVDIETKPSTKTIHMPTIASHENQVNRKASLASFDFRCPPRGESKVVLYFTSLRGVRRTYENCFDIRLILRGLGVYVDERDVWMHLEFRNELSEVLHGLFKGMPQVPQLFIKGRYIGGAEEVKQLHEQGILSCLMEGIALGLIHRVCNGCGDARFIPCVTCNGGRKVVDDGNEVTQCPVCNENGLIMCPMCNA